MTKRTDHNEMVQGEQPSLQPGSDQDYQLLEQDCYQSAAYAQMVERHPLLRRTIAARRGKGLVSYPETTPPSNHHPPGVVLQWERSHGEG